MEHVMSKETSEWLNTRCLIGNTDQRGNAWHYRADLQGTFTSASGREYQGNHYPGAIPVADVLDRLYGWQAVTLPVYVKVECAEDEAMAAAKDGDAVVRENLIGSHPVTGDPEPYVQWFRFIERPNRMNLSASDDYDADFYMASKSFTIHDYEEWLVKRVQTLIDDDLHISSAGLLDNRAVSWVEIAMDETRSVADFPFRPHLLAVTGVNGKTATQYGRKVQAVVCDNTLAAALSEGGQTIKYKHSKYSIGKLNDAREALGIVMATADAFSTQVEALVDWRITGKGFNDALNVLIPMVDDKGEALAGRSLTMAQNKRAEVQNLWANDSRCAPWKGTAFGLMQTFNTWDHHYRGARGTTVMPERNMREAINGKQDERDTAVLNAITATNYDSMPDAWRALTSV
jgi:phage/plasmid-like protein (TIGR03299 family)